MRARYTIHHRHFTRIVRPIPSLLALVVAAELYGCAAKPDSQSPSSSAEHATHLQSQPGTHPNSTIILTQPAGGGEPVATVIDARPAALVDGRVLNWGELRPALNEIAGAQALHDAILDRKIAQALTERKITITEDDVARERKALIESLNDDPDIAFRLLDDLRHKQRLGRYRFESLLRRNAGLRSLVQNQVTITPDAIERMHQIVHGPKVQARIIVVPDLNTAQVVINRVNSGDRFADLAVEFSTDTSAARGGLLEPISLADPQYPESLRQTLSTLEPGHISGPVLLGDRYAVVMFVKREPGDGRTLDETREAMARLARLSQERVLMDQLARQMIAGASVTVFDEHLNEAWSRERGEPK